MPIHKVWPDHEGLAMAAYAAVQEVGGRRVVVTGRVPAWNPQTASFAEQMAPRAAGRETVGPRRPKVIADCGVVCTEKAKGDPEGKGAKTHHGLKWRDMVEETEKTKAHRARGQAEEQGDTVNYVGNA